MNLVSSKIMKSSRPVNNRSVQTINSYSCELYIESFKISYRGYVYFMWAANNTQIHSLRYEANGKTVQVKQTLTITVRVSSKNGKEQPFNTYFKLMTEGGEELDECQLLINNFNAQYKEMEVPMDRGLILLKARRKSMNINEQQSVNLNYRGGLYRSKGGRLDEKSMQGLGGEYQSLQEQLSRVKKQLEDEVYLNNKLKNDRQVLLATKQQLQLQIETMIMQIAKEISVLRQHYENRMMIREHCYQQEIQDLVNLFNSNSEQSKKVVELILRQKMKLEEEMKPMLQKVKKYQLEINDKNQSYSKLQKEKFQLQIYLSQAEETILEKGKNIDIVNGQNSHLKDQLIKLNNQIDSLGVQLNEQLQKINGQGSSIDGLNQKIHQLQFELQNKDIHVRQLEENVTHSKNREEGLAREKQLMQSQIGLMEEQKKGLLEQIEHFKGRLQQFEYEMEFNQNVMGQLKKQQTQKQDQLYEQLQGLQALYSKKMEDAINGFQHQKQQYLMSIQHLQKQKEELEKKLADLQRQLSGSVIKMSELGGEIDALTNQIKSNSNNGEAKDQLIALMQKQIEKLKKQIQHFRYQQKKRIQNQNLSPAEALQKRTQEQLQKSREDKSNKINNLQQQIKRLAALLDDKTKQTEKMKQDRIKLQAQLQKKNEQINNKMGNSRHSKNKEGSPDKRSGVIDIANRPYSADQVKQVILKKQQQIGQLRKRVEELEMLYTNLTTKLEKISLKYPQVDIQNLDPTLPPHQWCDSEVQQEKLMNTVTPTGPNGIAGKSSTKRLLKKNSIGQAIQQEEDWNHSSKQISDKKYEPRSQKKIGDPQRDYQKGLLRKQSLAGTVTIQVPKSNGIKKDHSISYDPSQRSGTSYVKVSHSKKIKELQTQVKQLQDKQEAYKVKIDSYLKNIDSLNRQMQNMKGTLNRYGSEKSMKKLPQPKIQKQFENKQSQVVFEDQRLKNFMHESQIKQFELQKMNLRLGQIQEQRKNEKANAQKKIADYQNKFQEGQKRQQQYQRRQLGLNDNIQRLQKDIADLQQKLRKQKQGSQQLRLSIKQMSLHLDNAQNQLKKAKSMIETLEDKVQKLAGGEMVIRQLSKEIEELGKKSLEQTRTINHLKLEKDAIEEELRLLKKRQNDQLRIATEWQQKAASLQRALQQMKRKEGKLKRQIQQGQEEVRRGKLQSKKIQEQLQALSTAQMSWQVQRRKHLDEISSLQDQLSRKDYEINKLTKQIQKWRLRAEEKDQMRMGKKSQMREEIDRLESQLIRKQKKILEETQQNKLMRGRLELLERQNKRIMEQKNQSYGEKLKYYVDEMSSIKKLLEQYQNQNSRLKVDNNQLYEQSQIMRMNFDKMQMKYEEAIERQENILNDLQSYISEGNMLKDRLSQAHSELDQTEAAFANLRKEADDDKLLARRVTEKMENSQRNLQRALNEIREMKVRLSEYQTNQQINGKANEKLRALQRKKGQLQEQCRRLKSQYDNLVSVFIYKRQDLEKAVGQVRAQQRRLKDQQLQRMSQECNKTVISKTQRLQQQILDVYNESSRLRAQQQGLLEETGRQKGRITQLQVIVDRLGPIQTDLQSARYQIQQLKDQLRKKNDRVSKSQLTIEGLNSENNMKERQMIGLRNRIQELQSSLKQLNEEIQKRRNTERQLQDALSKATTIKEKERTFQDNTSKQRETQLIKEYQSRISNYQIQLQRAKDRELKSIQENSAKMKKLEEKMDQMQQALKQRQKAIEGHYEGEMRELQDSLLRISQQLEQKLLRIDELNEAVIILQGQNKDLTNQLQQARYQYEQQRQLLEAELAKLKAKMKQSETLYASNLRSLQEEVTKSAQMKNNISGSRMKGNEAQDRIAKRYEQKLKNKDRKIEELKQNIYTLEQTIVKLRKKDNIHQTTIMEIQKLKLAYADLDKERKTVQNKFQEELNRTSDIIRQLKRQILILKQNEEKLKLTAQEKILENQSMGCELRTLRQLYSQLQKQLQRRKHTLTNQLEEESSLQQQLRQQESQIIELEERLLEGIKQNKQLELDVRRKTLQIRKQTDAIQQFTKNQEKYKLQINKLTTEVNNLKVSLNQSTTTCESARNQLRSTKNQMTRLRKNAEDLRTSCLSKEETAAQLKKINDELTIRYRENQDAAQRFSMLNQRSRDQLGFGIEEIIQRFFANLEEKEGHINQLIQEIEELKFLNQRKFLDYDQLKKQNFELQIKIEDLDMLNEQLEQLRKICDRLQQQKKSSVFREQVLRMQLQNLANTGAPELRNRIEAILTNPSAPSYGSFSFY